MIYLLGKLVNTGHLMSASRLSRENEVTGLNIQFIMRGNLCVKKWLEV